MKILYYKEPTGNFGDDLNEFVWHELLPPHIFEIEDVVLLGIGTILNEQRTPLSETAGKRVFVLGSGAGYGRLPADWQHWRLLAVRGPLTAFLLGQPELAAADPAILLSLIRPLGNRRHKPKSILFIPHHNSAARGPWKEVAEAAGMTYVDPRWSMDVVLDHLFRARLVITEAMHGAIVADALRVPWIPVVIAPDGLPFKWKDWSLSLDMSYRPHYLPPSSAWEALYHRDLLRRAKAKGLPAHSNLVENDDIGALIRDLAIRYPPSETETEEKPRKAGSIRLRSILRSVSSTFDGFFVDRSAAALRRIAGAAPHLSDDAKLSLRIEQLQSAIHHFVAAVS